MAAELKFLKSDGTTTNISAKEVVVSLTKTNFSTLDSESIAEYYNNGVRAIFVEDGYTNLIPAAIGEYIPQNFNSFVGSYFFESLVAIILPTTVPTAVGRVRRRFFDEPTVIAAR